MNQAYNHEDIPLNTPIVRDLICELYSGKEYVKRSVIIEEVLQFIHAPIIKKPPQPSCHLYSQLTRNFK